jgi:hypothetical protein
MPAVSLLAPITANATVPTVNVVPLTGDLRIRLVDLPAVADSVAARLGGVAQQRREAHHPTVDGHVVDLDTALTEQLLDVAVGQAKAQVPADRNDDHAGRKRKPTKADRATGARRGRRVLMPLVSLLKGGHRNATAPPPQLTDPPIQEA